MKDRVVVVDDVGGACRSEESLGNRRSPGKQLPFDPQQIEAPTGQEFAQASQIAAEDRRPSIPSSRVQSFNVVVGKEATHRHVDAGLSQTGEVLKEAISAAGPGVAISREREHAQGTDVLN